MKYMKIMLLVCCGFANMYGMHWPKRVLSEVKQVKMAIYALDPLTIQEWVSANPRMTRNQYTNILDTIRDQRYQLEYKNACQEKIACLDLIEEIIREN